MDYKKEKELLVLILVFILVIDIAFMCQNINSNLFYIILISITIIAFFALLYVISMENKSKQKELDKILYYDPITGLANKNKFLNDLNDILKSKEKYAVVVFDMKNFKSFVDLNGINEANKYLKYIANIVKKETKEYELCANIVDEHFAMLYKYNYPIQIIKRIKDINSKIIDYDSNLKIQLSFGIYCITDKRYSPTLIFNKADLARKSIVEKYDILYTFYDDEIKKNNVELSDIENYMDSSLNNGDFIVDYQPKYKIDRKKLIGFEALIRWNHPKRGILFPSKFISIFESNGFITKLDFYVLEQVCKTIKCYSKKRKMVPISLNLSREDLKNDNLINDIEKIVDKYKIAHNLIEFEFTESIVFDDTKHFIEIVTNLKKDGFLTSIDDFGTGQSSLNALKNLPVDILKIDKGFLSNNNKNGQLIIKNVVKLAKKLDMKVIVEGIENKEEVKMLKNLECDYGQGFYYSKPLLKRDIDKLLK